MLLKELHNKLELPLKKSFFLLLRKSSLQNLFNKYNDSFTPFLRKNYATISDYTLVDPFRLDNILLLLEKALSVEGDVIECGSYKGGSGLLIGLWLKENKSTKKVFLFDSFEGLPEPNAEFDRGYSKGQFITEYDALVDKIAELGLQDTVYLVKGWFKNTIPPFLQKQPDIKFCFFHVDCDLYDSTLDCFPSVFPFISDSGIVIFDDYNDGGRGEKTAILKSLTNPTTINLGPSSQTWLVKNDTKLSGIQDGDIYYNFDKLVENANYLDWLKEKFDIRYDKILLDAAGRSK